MLAFLLTSQDETELLGGGGPSAWALQLYSQYALSSIPPLATWPALSISPLATRSASPHLTALGATWQVPIRPGFATSLHRTRERTMSAPKPPFQTSHGRHVVPPTLTPLGRHVAHTLTPVGRHVAHLPWPLLTTLPLVPRGR